MAVSTDVLRSHTDLIILSQLMQEDCYGYKVSRDILGKTGQKYELKEATLYSAFRRLEKEGLIRSYWGDEDLGARRRYYAITEDGRTAFEGFKTDWEELKSIIDALVAGAESAEGSEKAHRKVRDKQ